jgi:hypothetical protein
MARSKWPEWPDPNGLNAKKNGRRSEECACRLTKSLQALGGVHLLAGSLHALRARPCRQKLVVGEFFTSILIDAVLTKGLQYGQPEVTLPYIY